MARRKEKLSLGAFLLFTGHHVAAWRHPAASDSHSLADFVGFARAAEAAKFDAVFLADICGSPAPAVTDVGTPTDIADQLEDLFQNDGADGFNIMSPVLPTGLTDFIELVLPELRRRNLFRSDYEGPTLRDHLGLKRPANSFRLPRADAAE